MAFYILNFACEGDNCVITSKLVTINSKNLSCSRYTITAIKCHISLNIFPIFSVCVSYIQLPLKCYLSVNHDNDFEAMIEDWASWFVNLTVNISNPFSYR